MRKTSQDSLSYSKAPLRYFVLRYFVTRLRIQGEARASRVFGELHPAGVVVGYEALQRQTGYVVRGQALVLGDNPKLGA